MVKNLSKILATFFYIGYIPCAPGTVASAVGVLLYIVIESPFILYISAFLIITVLGFIVSGSVEKMLGMKDPACIVIDEVAGILLALFLLPLKWPVLIAAFILFRVFDIFKPYPVNKFENFKGGTGIMLDDLMAGLYTNLIMQVALRWVGII